MKPRFFLTTALLAMIMLYIPVDAAYENLDETKHPHVNELKFQHMQTNQHPVTPAAPEEKKPMMGHKEGTKHTGKSAHAEEDGKHHHFHMDRVKRMKRFCNIFTLFTKCFLAITHICMLIGVFKAIVH